MIDISIYWEVNSGLELFWPVGEYDDCSHWIDALCHPEVYGEFGRVNEQSS